MFKLVLIDTITMYVIKIDNYSFCQKKISVNKDLTNCSTCLKPSPVFNKHLS